MPEGILFSHTLTCNFSPSPREEAQIHDAQVCRPFRMINLTQRYHEFLDSGDPRVATWPMMDNPMKGVTLVIMYLGFVKMVGPAWMRDQKPYDLRYLMVVYNFSLVAVSAWMFVNFGMLGWFTTYSWRCEPIDYSYNADAIKMAELGWYFYITKFVEFADTIFFILRKKDSQISSLHVFHHSLVPITLWFGIKYGAGGYNSIFAFLNSFVHIWMYLYYGLSALGPAFQKYLWWKKYLTMLQMVQFSIVFAFMVQLTFFPTCEVSKPLLLLNVVQAVIFFALFLNFFLRSYQRKKRHEDKKEALKQNSVVSCPKKLDDQDTNGYVRFRKSSVQKVRYVDVNYVTEAVTISA